jgi:phosphonopyruvate decarboxylase
MEISTFCQILREQGIFAGSGVPCSVFTPLVNAMSADAALDYLPATSEGEAVAIAAGMIAAGKPAFALMQNSGLGNAVNPLTSLIFIYGIPAVLLVSHRGEPGGKPDEPQHRLMGEMTADLARLCGLRTMSFDPERFQGELAAAQREGVAAAWIFPQGRLKGGPQAAPIQLTLQIGQGSSSPAAAAEQQQGQRFVAQISRERALEAMLPLLNHGAVGGPAPAVISTTGKLSRELYELDDREHGRTNRFYMVGSMGCAAGFGMGVARAQPQRKVVVLDGDGALLMKLGTLATLGHHQLSNFHHVVLDNGAYESTGGQPTTSSSVDFAAVASACGFRSAVTVDDAAGFFSTLEQQLQQRGPTLLRVLVSLDSRHDLGRPRLSPRDGWLRFCQFLGERGER